jgi:hypothetical protein
VLFGTGRLWAQDDVTPCMGSTVVSECQENHSQYIFGIKEPLTSEGYLTFEDMSGSNIVDVSGAKVFRNGSVTGLAPNAAFGPMQPGGPLQYYDLSMAIKGSSAGGYKKMLDSRRIFYNSEGLMAYEMVITQPKLAAMGNGVSYMAFSSFLPKEAGCGENGYGFLHLVDAFTGLPAPALFEALYTSAGLRPTALEDGEVGGVLATGMGVPTEAYIMSTADGMTASTSAPDMSVHSISLPKGDGSLHGVTSWKEVLDYGFAMPKDKMSEGL